jgi:uncharacterized protein (DUF2252 family)
MESIAESQRASGKAARKVLPRSDLAFVYTGPDRDPVAMLRAQDTSRVDDLVPLRWDRMLVSPFTFFRGSAALMAHDLGVGPSTEFIVQCCGDAHLGNFGMYFSPERRLVFDINDFDETAPAPFEWDMKRLITSIAIAGRHIGCDRDTRRAILHATSSAYREYMAMFAGMSSLEVFYNRLDVDDVLAVLERESSKAIVQAAQKQVTKSETRTSLRSFEKLTTVVDGQRRFVDDPPIVQRLDDTISHEVIDQILRRYRMTLPPERALLLGRYRYVDGARKVVGVGSVGTRCFIGLFQGDLDTDVLILQMKEANPSVLRSTGLPAQFPNEGERVVVGQKLMQAVSDVFLGWTERVDVGREYYVRQLHDGKGAINLDALSGTSLSLYGRTCAYVLARGHARTGNPRILSGYLGNSERFDEAMARFAEEYADLTERDYETAIAARNAGIVPTLR